MTIKIGFFTLGCKVNQYETQAMEQLLQCRGAEAADPNQACDGYVINTCSVTAEADRKCRTLIRRVRRDHPQAVVGVCGCYSQHDPQAVRQLDADVISGSGGREAFVDGMLEAIRTRSHWEQVDNALARRQFERLPAGGLEGRTRAMLKVQDGCCNFCTYCIIPYTRGPVRSAPLAQAVEQAEALAGQGYQELVVTGIEIASWGVDLPGKPPLTELVEALCRQVPRCRVRLGSLEPRIVTEEFCRRLAELPNLCPQFHLSLQSGSDEVLKRMHRRYDTARYLQSVELLNRYFPGCAVTTDVIVGFPGETEQEFQQTLAFLETCGFAAIHVFPYSRRPGTPADTMPGQLTGPEKEARSRRAIDVGEALSAAWRRSLVGTVQQVLFEEDRDGVAMGHAANYAVVYAPGSGLHNVLRPVEVTGVCRDGVEGRILPDTL